ncbi:FAD-dependent oxidoreductase [Sphingobacterium suaedae]|uniref:FAD-dependent oxidoreductase n=1 Tax=Sphingobacterium suaedae TaxID=1686402 RepID=A0ABW5KD64_9SPHI
MLRDGKNKSVWQETSMSVSKPAEILEKYDVLIVGAGITGLTTAVRLLEMGKTCLLTEANRVGFGTTSGTSAHLNTVLDTPYTQIIKQHGVEKARRVLESTREAIRVVEGNVARYHIECDLERCHGIMYAQNEKEKDELTRIRDAIKELGIPCEEIEGNPLSVPSLYAIQFQEQGRFHPTKYLKGLLKAVLDRGGHILEQTLVQHVTEKDGARVIKTADGRMFVADNVVYATHTPPGIQQMSFRLSPYRSYIQVWELVENYVFPDEVVYDMQEPFHYFRQVVENGKTYLMVGGQDHKTAHHQNEQYNFLELEAFVRGTLPAKQKRYEWSSQYYESQDSLPFIGQFPGPGHDNEYIATGFGGNGMIFGSLSGVLIADLIVNKSSTYSDLYSPARVGPLSSIPDLLLENLDVVKHFIQDRFTWEKVEGMVELACGEGKIVKYEGERVGVYKDEEGHITAVDPVCRHAACVVKWNNTEHSWDCPCHGARYAPDGSLLNGPSVAPLKRWEFDQEASAQATDDTSSARRDMNE